MSEVGAGVPVRATAGALLAALALAGCASSGRTIAEDPGPPQWRAVAFRGVDGICLELREGSGGAGACELTRPGTLREAGVLHAGEDDQRQAVALGPVPPGTATVEVVGEGFTVEAAPVDVDLGIAFFAVPIPSSATVDLRAYDERGRLLEERPDTPAAAPR